MRSRSVRAYVLLSTLMLSCIPDNVNDRPGWGLFPGATGSNGTGSSPGVLVVGDSLVFNAEVQTLANEIRFFLGTNAVVPAAGGASVAHFNKQSLISAAGLSTIEQYVNFLGDVRIAVIALGSNDARIITGELGTDGGYTLDEYRGQIDLAVDTALARSRCVVLVNVANHWSITDPAVVRAINAKLAELGTGNPAVRTADWDAHSAPHPSWFSAPDDIHHSAAGEVAYRSFIIEAINDAMESGC